MVATGNSRKTRRTEELLARVEEADRARKLADAAFKRAVARADAADGVTLGDLASAAGMTKQGVISLLHRAGAR